MKMHRLCYRHPPEMVPHNDSQTSLSQVEERYCQNPGIGSRSLGEEQVEERGLRGIGDSDELEKLHRAEEVSDVEEQRAGYTGGPSRQGGKEEVRLERPFVIRF